jgi:hypothetical protein
MRRVLVPLVSALVLTSPLWIAWPALGQFGVTGFDPSVQSAGMGGATVAVFWQDAPNVWSNPALASGLRGIRYSYGSTELMSGFLEEVTLQSHQIFVGGYGVGLEISGKPIESLGRVRLNLGTGLIGPGVAIQPYQEVRSLALGVDLFSLLANLQAARGSEPSPILRRVSVAAGHTWKDIVQEYEIFTDTSDAKDFGALVRVSPVDQIERLGETNPETRYRLELAGGYSEQNYEVTDWKRFGASVRLTMAPPTSGEGFIQEFGSPAVALGLAWTADRTFSSEVHQYGAEASLWDVVFLRGGFDDLGGGRRRASAGGGVAFTYRKAVGARFDYAWNERMGDLDDWHRFQVTAFLDPLRF